MRILICLFILSSLTSCFSYRDMNHVIFYTMGVFDENDEQFLFYGEGFKAFRAEGEKAGTEKRLALFGEGSSLTVAVGVMRNSVNYPIDYAGNKSNVFTKKIAEHGIEDVLDIVHRDQKPSLRVYMFVYDGTGSDLINFEIEDEPFMGLYLYEMMNSQKTTMDVIASQYYEFIEKQNTGSGINVLPLISKRTIEEMAHLGTQEGQGSDQNKGSEKKGSDKSSEGNSDSKGNEGSVLTKPYILFDGAAVFVKSKMVAQLERCEVEVYKLLTSKVTSGLVNTENPDFPDSDVGFTVLKNKFKSKVALKDGRIQLDYNLTLKVVLLEAEKGIGSDAETLTKLKLNLEDTIKQRTTDFFEKMKRKKIDILDIKRKLELAHLDPETDDIMGMTDFNVKVNVIIDGTGKLKDSYY